MGRSLETDAGLKNLCDQLPEICWAAFIPSDLEDPDLIHQVNDVGHAIFTHTPSGRTIRHWSMEWHRLQFDLTQFVEWFQNTAIPATVKGYLLAEAARRHFRPVNMPGLLSLAQFGESYFLRAMAIRMLGHLTAADAEIIDWLATSVDELTLIDPDRIKWRHYPFLLHCEAFASLGRLATDSHVARELLLHIESSADSLRDRELAEAALLLAAKQSETERLAQACNRIRDPNTYAPFRLLLIRRLLECHAAHEFVVSAILEGLAQTELPRCDDALPVYGSEDFRPSEPDPHPPERYWGADDFDPHEAKQMAFELAQALILHEPRTHILVDQLEAVSRIGRLPAGVREALLLALALTPARYGAADRVVAWTHECLPALVPSILIGLEAHGSVTPNQLAQSLGYYQRRHRIRKQTCVSRHPDPYDRMHVVMARLASRLFPSDQVQSFGQFLEATGLRHLQSSDVAPRVLSLSWAAPTLDRVVGHRLQNNALRKRLTVEELRHSIASEFTLALAEDVFAGVQPAKFVDPRQGLYRAFDNAAVRFLRSEVLPRRARRPEGLSVVEYQTPSDSDLLELFDRTTDPLNGLLRAERVTGVLHALDSALSIPEAEVIHLRYRDGLARTAVAGLLQMPYERVRSLEMRALAKLRHALLAFAPGV